MYPAKLAFIIKGEIKTFHYKQKLKEFMTTKPALLKILKEFYTWKRNINPTEKYRKE
jgi:hypothetical protein